MTPEEQDLVRARQKSRAIVTGLLLGFAQLAENILEARLGKRPSRTFWYGHSALSGDLNAEIL